MFPFTGVRLAHAGPDAHAFWQFAAVVVGIAGLATSILASRRGHELLGLVACGATGLLVSPISWSHHYAYVVPALVLAAYGPRRLGYRILGAALVVGLFGWWPLPIGNQGGYDPNAQLLPRGLLPLAPNGDYSGAAVEYTWRGLELTAGNYYVLTLLVFIAATACALVPASRLRLERAAPALLTDRAYETTSEGLPRRDGRELDHGGRKGWLSAVRNRRVKVLKPGATGIRSAPSCGDVEGPGDQGSVGSSEELGAGRGLLLRGDSAGGARF